MSFLDFYENQHINPTKIDWKEEIYQDLFVLEQSMVSIDGLWQLSTSFLQEAVKLTVNSIVLFERGYHDSAYYSLRQSLEVALSIVFFANKNEDERNEILTKWKRKESNLMYARMFKELTKKATLISDVLDKMKHIVDETRDLKKFLDKEIHKEGLSTFYVVRSHPLNCSAEKRSSSNEEFKKLVLGSIKGLILFRLCLDPLPILLGDPQIYKRTPVFMTEAFPEDFLTKYFSASNIEIYQSTEIYKDAYNQFIIRPEMNPSTLMFLKDSFINYEHIDQILEQKYLLSETQLICTTILKTFSHVTKIYPDGQMLEMYFTSLESPNSQWGFLHQDPLLEEILNKKEFINVSSNKVFISSVFVNQRYFVFEHINKI